MSVVGLHDHRCARGARAVLILGLLVVASACAARAADEGPTVQKITVTGNTLVRTEDILNRMRTRVGEPLEPDVLEGDFRRILQMNYFQDVQFQRQDLDGGVHLWVVVDEKDLIRRVVFRGNEQVSESQLESLVSSKVGMNYDAGVVNRDVRAIRDWYLDEYYYFADVEAYTEPFEDGVRLVFDIDEGGRVVIDDVVFHGNTVFSKDELVENMATKPSGFLSRVRYDRREFERDLERIRIMYQGEGYLNVEVREMPFELTGREPTSRWQQRQLVVHIGIDEGRQYQVGRIDFRIHPPEGQERPVHTDEELREVVEIMPGDPYSPIEANEDADHIRGLYGGSGRIFTKVSAHRILPEDPDSTVVDLVYEIQESAPVVVEGIEIEGLVKTQERVVRREMELYPGETFDSSKMEESIRNLNRLDFFERPIAWDVKKGTDPDQAKVVIDVNEKPTGRLSLGVGLSSAEGVVGSFNIKQRNFDRTDHPDNFRDLLLGKAYTGAGEYFSFNLSSGSRSQDVSVDFLNPWIWNRPIRFGFGGFYRSRDWSSHDEERTGGYVLVGRHIFGKNWDLSARYSLERIKMTDFGDDVSRDLRAEEGDNLVSRGALRLTYDTRDDVFEPTEGWYAWVSQEVAGGPFLGDKDFWRARAHAQYFYTIWRDETRWERAHVLGLRADLAKADAYGDNAKVPTYDRWYAGGIGSLRGFDYHAISPQSLSGDPIGGESMITGSAEYFFPLFEDTIRGSLYYDVGTVRKDVGDWGGDWRSAWGVGLHMRTPLGPLPVRVYYSVPIQEEEGDDTANVQFTFGAIF